MKIEDIRTELEHLMMLADRIPAGGAPCAAERDLMLEKLRAIYDALLFAAPAPAAESIADIPVAVAAATAPQQSDTESDKTPEPAQEPVPEAAEKPAVEQAEASESVVEPETAEQTEEPEPEAANEDPASVQTETSAAEPQTEAVPEAEVEPAQQAAAAETKNAPASELPFEFDTTVQRRPSRRMMSLYDDDLFDRIPVPAHNAPQPAATPAPAPVAAEPAAESPAPAEEPVAETAETLPAPEPQPVVTATADLEQPAAAQNAVETEEPEHEAANEQAAAQSVPEPEDEQESEDEYDDNAIDIDEDDFAEPAPETGHTAYEEHYSADYDAPAIELADDDESFDEPEPEPAPYESGDFGNFDIKPLASQQPVQSAPVLGDVMNGEVETLGDRMAAQAPGDLSEQLAHAPVDDLKSALSINDRYLIISELFGGDADACDRALDSLNAAESAEEAIIFIEENFSWNSRSEATELIIDLLERKFSR